ncbi:MAG: hypothetical protein AMJ91_07900 [candidate division Zixibacteria bacterium SM23_73_3]|nr:MAG: hypothetical protein AMJ91_07900 [candidate division Zixibacteria bacterium SM23_73_3]
MNLRKTTLLAIIGICYHFALRAVGTFSPDIFRILLVAQIAQITSMLAHLTIVLFFIFFIKDYVQKEQVELKKATGLAIVGSSAMLLVNTKGLLIIVFRTHLSPDLLWSLERSNYIGVLLPWISSILILFFFISFYKETVLERKMKLRKATLSAVIGSSINALVLTFVLLNSLFLREIIHLVELSRKIAIIFIPIFVFSFVAVLYFFLTFYKEQEKKVSSAS